MTTSRADINAPVERPHALLKRGLAVVSPVERALVLLSAFSPQERWFGNGQLALRTGLPPSTVARIAQSLVHLGYLIRDSVERKYRLSPAVLGLGYAAIAHSALQSLAGERMAAFAHQQRVHVGLAMRDRLDLVVLECRRGLESRVALPLHVGMRVGIVQSPMGWSLLAALPELERSYLLENVQRHMTRDWAPLRRRLLEGIAQIGEKGYCTAIGEWEPELGVIAAPVRLEGNAPFVLTCIGGSQAMSRARVERELGPSLLVMAQELQSEFNTIGT
ncbi:IclR family transcriptional regulator [Pandoraea terrigena]|uniref:IclR family transcriptional regulator n=1 Tax=Pandoraea terrigena TaxID=2508292 RepID=A0A5E4YMW6_9BURK|nr:IclR family transcriptional regulator [Pandoraea terrigena]VVE50126.1 IclR family transcriptional regulator [Pandoraea terrigena]